MRTGRWRWIAVACCICAICVLSACMILNERASCMGVPILSEKEQGRYTEYEYCDLSPYLFFRGEQAAIDLKSSTIYISQNIEASTMSWDLQGKLEIILSGYELYFEESPDFNALADAMQAGRAFKLFACDGSSKYMAYNVIFTSLPVIRMDGAVTSVNEEGRDIWSGDFCIWASDDPDSGSYTVKTNKLQWHVRGFTSAGMPKKSLKLSMKTANGENADASLLGMGEDDDWILNAMYMDDTKIREKLMMELWNELAEYAGSKMKMSCGEYAETVINGEYGGLYLLQRRVDKKYLQLEDDSIILKGKTYGAATIEEVFDIVYSSVSDEEAYGFAKDIYHGNVAPIIDIDHFIDCCIMIRLSAAYDNAGNKNMFFTFVHEGDGYKLYHIPWDTDMSFGICPDFVYDYDCALSEVFYRREYQSCAEMYPELEEKIKSRWRELRNSLFTDEEICYPVDVSSALLRNSGGYYRDEEKWGFYQKGKDIVENLRKYILERASLMDKELAS